MRIKDARALARIRLGLRRFRDAMDAATADPKTLQLIPANAHALRAEAKRLDGMLTDRLNGWEESP